MILIISASQLPRGPWSKRKAVKLAQGSDQASVAALTGHSFSGHEAHLDIHDETPHQCWQCGGEGWVLGGSLGKWH